MKADQPLILVFTARDSLDDNVNGLQQGADDDMIKPLEPALLKARIQALLRGASRPLPEDRQWGDLQLTIDGRTASYATSDLHLTPKEHGLLKAPLKAGGRACSKDHLIQAAWNWAESQGEGVKTHFKNIRAKVANDGAPPDLIEMVYGVGLKSNRNYA